MASDRVRGDSKETVVVLDSSMIMAPFEFSIQLEDEFSRLFGRYRVVVPTPVVKELEVLVRQAGGRKQQRAKAGLKLIQRYETMDVNESLGDDAVLAVAQKLGGVVATNDRELRLQAHALSLSVVFLREKQRLVLEG